MHIQTRLTHALEEYGLVWGVPSTTMQDENMGTAMVTPANASAYCSARLPKKMQKPEAMAKPMEDLFSCIKAQHRHHLHRTLGTLLEGRKEDSHQATLQGIAA